MQKTQKNFFLHTSRGLKKFLKSQILYVRQYGRDLEIETESGSYIAKGKKITSLEEIEDKRFFRCHKYAIVNLSVISRIANNEVIFDNGKKLSLGDKNYHKIINFLKLNYNYHTVIG